MYDSKETRKKSMPMMAYETRSYERKPIGPYLKTRKLVTKLPWVLGSLERLVGTIV